MPLPVIVICIILLIVVWTVLASLARNGGKEKLWIWLNRILLVLFIIVILRMTVFTRSFGTNHEGWKLFGKLQVLSEQPEYFREMLMNLFLFVPFGLMAPFVFIRDYSKGDSIKIKRTVFIVIFLAFFLSVVIELLQLAMSLGVPEAEDIICNTLGAAVGTLAFVIWNRTY